MVEPEKRDKEKDLKGGHFLRSKPIEIVSGVLMFAGIILSFFYSHIGGMLVGLGFGLCFFDEIYHSFLQLRDFYSEQGLFKALMWAATILFFLISIPVFIIATAIGFGAIFLIRRSFKK